MCSARLCERRMLGEADGQGRPTPRRVVRAQRREVHDFVHLCRVMSSAARLTDQMDRSYFRSANCPDVQLADVPTDAKATTRSTDRRRVPANPQLRRAAISRRRGRFLPSGDTRGPRSVRSRAGRCDARLVVMHFSTKEQLFLQAVPGTRDLVDRVKGGSARPGRNGSRPLLERMESAIARPVHRARAQRSLRRGGCEGLLAAMKH